MDLFYEPCFYRLWVSNVSASPPQLRYSPLSLHLKLLSNHSGLLSLPLKQEMILNA